MEDLCQTTRETLATLRHPIEATNTHPRKSGLSTIGIDVQDLGELVVVDDRKGQHDGTRVHEGERRGHSDIGEIGVERLELTRRQHALVDDCPRRE